MAVLLSYRTSGKNMNTVILTQKFLFNTFSCPVHDNLITQAANNKFYSFIDRAVSAELYVLELLRLAELTLTDRYSCLTAK